MKPEQYTPPRRHRWPLWLAAALLTLGFAALGQWQLRRADYKERLLAAQSAAVAATPRALADALAGDADLPERVALPEADAAAVALPLRVRGQLTLDPDTVVLLDNQVLDGQAGVEAYGLAVTRPPSRPLLVDLGWFPLDSARHLPRITLSGRTELVTDDALLTAAPRAGLRLGVATVTRHATTLVNYLDPAALRGCLDPRLSNAVLLPAAPLQPGRHRDPADTMAAMPPERHRGYALQWFGLAAAVVVVALILTLKNRA
jgi:cytochrome oxidase assembly protein ShyY1